MRESTQQDFLILYEKWEKPWYRILSYMIEQQDTYTMIFVGTSP